jgi:two-component system, response regulator
MPDRLAFELSAGISSLNVQAMDNRSILLVEDNPDDEALARRAFSESLITNPVIVARDGEEALKVLTAPGSELPAIVLLDLKLPKTDGLEVLKAVRADPRTKNVPVVILTSSRHDMDLIAAYALGCNNYIRKPLDFDEFVDLIGTLARYWLQFNEPNPAGGDD